MLWDLGLNALRLSAFGFYSRDKDSVVDLIDDKELLRGAGLETLSRELCKFASV